MNHVAPAESANLVMMRRVFRALRGLEDRLVLVGGCAVTMTVARTGHFGVRSTDDVDVVTAVGSVIGYQSLEGELRRRGFQPDPEVICRYRSSSTAIDKIDVMPSDPKILGFASQWYEHVLQDWRWQDIGEGLKLRIASPATLLATKMEACNSRGADDLYSSHDLEDIVSLFDAVHDLPAQVAHAAPPVRDWIAEELETWLGDAELVDAIGSHAPPDETSRQRIPAIIQRMRETTETAFQ